MSGKYTGKFWRVALGANGTTTCPVCGQVNKHTTGHHCGHLHKITKTNIAFYWWAFRPTTP